MLQTIKKLEYKKYKGTKVYPNPKLGQLIDRGKKKTTKKTTKKQETDTKVKVKISNKLYT